MKKRILAALLTSAMVLSFAGCSQEESGGGDSTTPAPSAGGDTSAADTAEPEGTTIPENVITGEVKEDSFVVWTWNTDVQTILDKVLKEVDPDLYGRIVYVNTGGSDYYQDKLDNILADPSNELYPDVVFLEADYIMKYTGGQNLKNIADLGITEADYADQYKYTVDIGTSPTGDLKALSWQAAPGAWVIRTDLAEKYLGTTDPAQIQEKLKDWDAVYETAKAVKEASGGETKLLPGWADLERVYMGARSSGWYGTDNKLVIDPAMTEYMDYAKKLYDEDLTWNTDQWSDPWAAAKTDDSTLALPGCTWYTYWSTDKNHFGSYILVQGPQPYCWGGTWMAATTGCADDEAAAKLIKYFTCDADFMQKINAANADYVNNKTALNAIIAANTQAVLDGVHVLNEEAQGESFISFFSTKSNPDGINGLLLTAQDKGINSAFETQVKDYVTGKIDKDTAIANFKATVSDLYGSWLTVE